MSSNNNAPLGKDPDNLFHENNIINTSAVVGRPSAVKRDSKLIHYNETNTNKVIPTVPMNQYILPATVRDMKAFYIPHLDSELPIILILNTNAEAGRPSVVKRDSQLIHYTATTNDQITFTVPTCKYYILRTTVRDMMEFYIQHIDCEFPIILIVPICKDMLQTTIRVLNTSGIENLGYQSVNNQDVILHQKLQRTLSVSPGISTTHQISTVSSGQERVTNDDESEETMFTDASMKAESVPISAAFGGHFGPQCNHRGFSTGFSGIFSQLEKQYCGGHIVAYELLGMLKGLEQLIRLAGKPFPLAAPLKLVAMCDNYCAVNYVNDEKESINKKDQQNPLYNNIIQQILKLCKKYNIYLRAEHVYRDGNKSADALSRLPEIYQMIKDNDIEFEGGFLFELKGILIIFVPFDEITEHLHLSVIRKFVRGNKQVVLVELPNDLNMQRVFVQQYYSQSKPVVNMYVDFLPAHNSIGSIESI